MQSPLESMYNVRMTLHAMLDRLPNDLALLQALMVLLRPWLDLLGVEPC